MQPPDRPLVERLRSGDKPGNPDGVYGVNRIPLCAEAADRIEELERKVTTTITLDDQVACIEARLAMEWVKHDPQEAAMLTAYLTSLRELRAAQWISVKDRLPESDLDVLVYHILGDRAICNKAYDVAAYVNGKWIFPWDRGNLNNPPQWVIHWMPLPSPPSTEGTNK